MKISTLIRRIAMTFVSLCVAFILLVALVNLSVFDEELRPEVSSILPPPDIPPHKNNAYTYVTSCLIQKGYGRYVLPERVRQALGI